MQTVSQKPGQGLCGRVGRYIFGMRLLKRSFLACRNFATFWNESGQQQTVDALWICQFHQLSSRERGWLVRLHILREASASLLVLLIRAMRRPQGVGRAASVALAHFL